MADQHHCRILVVSHLDVVRRGLRAMLDRQPGWNVVGEATDCHNAAVLATQLNADLVVVDFNMPDLAGVETARLLVKNTPLIRVLAVASHPADGLIEAVFSAGALGYVSLGDPETAILDAANTLLQDRIFLAAPLFRRLRDMCRPAQAVPKVLSQRDEQIIRMLARGYTNRRAADALGVSVRAFEGVRARMMHRLRLETLADLVRYAIRNRILDD